MKILIRTAQILDLPLVEEIEKKAYKNYHNLWDINTFKDILSKNDLYLFKVLKDTQGAIIGYVVLLITDDVGELHKITISESHQGQGLGRWALEEIIKELEQKNIKEIILEVLNSNIKAIALYNSLGFNQIGLRKNYYKIKDLSNKFGYSMQDAIVMQLKL